MARKICRYFSVIVLYPIESVRPIFSNVFNKLVISLLSFDAAFCSKNCFFKSNSIYFRPMIAFLLMLVPSAGVIITFSVFIFETSRMAFLPLLPLVTIFFFFSPSTSKQASFCPVKSRG